MKIIDFECIRSLDIPYIDCYSWVDEMIWNKRESILPAKTHMNLPGNVFCNVMPCIEKRNGHLVGGVKVVTRYPQRKPSLDSKILLMDMETGNFLAMMDGNWITAMRTGAVAAHSIFTFAKPDHKVIGIVGLGNTARATLLVLLEKEKNRELKIKLLKYKDQADLFIERFKDYDNIEFTIVESVGDLIKGSDVVVSCVTYFETDICEDQYFDEGILVVPVHTRGFTNCDLFFDKVYADDTGHVDHFKNFDKFKYFAEVSDVLNGTAKGRESDTERILAYNIGVSIHDIYFASRIYDVIIRDPEKQTVIPEANMKDPVEKFWV